MTGVDVERTKALAEKAELSNLVAMTTGVKGGDHWYICDDNESVAMIAANDGIDEELRQPRAELFAHAVNAMPALVAAVERVQALHTPWTNQIGEKWCRECTRLHPCLTIRALESPKESHGNV